MVRPFYRKLISVVDPDPRFLPPRYMTKHTSQFSAGNPFSSDTCLQSFMPLNCNINARGKRARLIYGVILLIVGIVLLFAWAIPAGSVWAWIITIACMLSGGFAIFEARAGWCIVRAMGFKTPV
jgi:hypothetical protein